TRRDSLAAPNPSPTRRSSDLAGTRRYIGTYPAEPGQVRVARAGLAGWLGGRPLTDEVILVASEFATNAVLHSDSGQGGAFTLRADRKSTRLNSSQSQTSYAVF